MKLSAVLFDLDGTLVDSAPGIESSTRQALCRVFPDVQMPPVRPFIGPPIRKIFGALMQSVGIADSTGAAMAELESLYRSDYDGRGWALCEPYQGVVWLLESLRQRGIARFVVTNKPTIPTGHMLRHLGLDRLFTDVVCPDSVTPRFASKAAAVEAIIMTHGIDPSTAVLVGDSEDDADAARRNGLKFIAALYGYGLVDGPPADALTSLSTFQELTPIVESFALQPQ